MRSFVAFTLVTLCAGPLLAQQSQNPMSLEALAKAKIGSWAEYEITMAGQQPIKMKYALIDKTAKNMALELDTSSPMGPVLVRMGFVSDGDGGWKMNEGKMRMANLPVQDLPAAQRHAGDVLKTDTPGKLIGVEKVTVPAGSFECKHYTRELQKEAGGGTADLWMSDRAGPTGLVKMKGNRGVEISLMALGGDAKAKLPSDSKPTDSKPVDSKPADNKPAPPASAK